MAVFLTGDERASVCRQNAETGGGTDRSMYGWEREAERVIRRK